MAPRVLVVEDDRDIADLVQLHLRDLEIEAEVAYTGVEGWEKLQAQNYDLVVLDVMLPGLDGLEICRRVRASSHYTLTLMLTSKSTELDRVLGLEMGADDYLTKPFSIRELLARVKALFRRAEALRGAAMGQMTGMVSDVASQSVASGTVPSLPALAVEMGRDSKEMSRKEVIRVGELSIEVDKRKVTLGKDIVNLTAREFDLLYQFASHPGRVYTRVQLLDQVWGLGYEGYEHTVNSHINRLRAKIEKDPAHPCYLLTVWGVGYKFVDEWN